MAGFGMQLEPCLGQKDGQCSEGGHPAQPPTGQEAADTLQEGQQQIAEPVDPEEGQQKRRGRQHRSPQGPSGPRGAVLSALGLKLSASVRS